MSFAAAQREALRAGWREAGVYADLTLGEAVARAARERSTDAVVFAPVDGSVTKMELGALYRRAQDVAARLHGAGIGCGDVVLLQAPVDASSTEALVALWILGAVVVPLSTTAGPEEVVHVLRQTKAQHAIVTPTWRDQDLAAAMVICHEGTRLRSTLVLGEDGPSGTRPIASLEPSRMSDEGRTDPSSVACVLYTSGSTAAPKGVRHSHETLLCGVNVAAARTTRTLATFPAGHVASLLGLLRPLTAGGTTVVMDRWSARTAVQLIEEFGITASAGTPFFLATLLDQADRSGRDISTLSRFLVGAATVPPALIERAESAGIVSWRTYGSTEHPAVSSGSPDDPPVKRRLTDGRITPGNEVRLVDQEGHDVSFGDEGEIVSCGPKQFLGYQDSAADQDAFLDSVWYRTGDLGRFDDDEYLVVTDRMKDTIIRGGENISAREVEEVVAQHPAVGEVAVCAAPDDLWGEVVCAFVVPRPGADRLSKAELERYAERVGLAKHKVPAQLMLVRDLPRTASGKVRKRELKLLLAARQVGAAPQR